MWLCLAEFKQVSLLENGDIVREAWTAITAGADIVYVDTGRIDDLRRITQSLKPVLQEMEATADYRKVEFAFGGGVRYGDLDALKEAGADIVGVGRCSPDGSASGSNEGRRPFVRPR